MENVYDLYSDLDSASGDEADDDEDDDDKGPDPTLSIKWSFSLKTPNIGIFECNNLAGNFGSF